jgi:RHS repeat-associated protein
VRTFPAALALVLAAATAPAQQQLPPAPETVIRPDSTGQGFDYLWDGTTGSTYFVMGTEDLASWFYFNTMEQGDPEGHRFWFYSNSPHFFLKLRYTAEPTHPWSDPDNDGLTNAFELEYDLPMHLAPFSTALDPFEPDYAGSSILRHAETTAGGDVVRRETRVVDLSGRITGVHTSATAGATTTTLAAMGYTVDALGRRTVARREDGSTWNYGYNDRSEVTSGSKKLPDESLAAGLQFGYAYDSIGNRTSMDWGGDEDGKNLRTTEYTPTDLNQYSAIANPRSLDVVVRSPDTVVVASSGNTVTLVDQGTYNRAEVTTTATTAQWIPVGVTANNNPLSQGHLWMPAASVAPQYDDDGNLTNDGRWDYVWDGENRLVSMQRAAGVPGPNLRLEFRYDHRSRRIAKKVIDLDGNAVLSDLRFAYDGWNLAAVFDASGEALVLLSSCTWGPDLSNSLQGAGGVGGLLAVRVGESDYYPSLDGNGNIIAWSDSTGAVRRRIDYDPFGNVTTVENTATTIPAIPFGFSTKYTDAETGLLYYGFRYYDPVSGRWISRDPIEERGGVNLYGFVGNAPPGQIDALGQTPAYPNCCQDETDRMRTAWEAVKTCLEKHENLMTEIERQYRNLAQEPNPLPWRAPGDLVSPSLSQYGHLHVLIPKYTSDLENQRRRLPRLMAEYEMRLQMQTECIKRMDPRCYCDNKESKVEETAGTKVKNDIHEFSVEAFWFLGRLAPWPGPKAVPLGPPRGVPLPLPARP